MVNTTLHEKQVKKKKRLKKLSYFALVIMIILLILPVAFRIVLKDRNADVVKVEDIVMILNCNTASESITSTFLNGDPGTLTYKIRGNQLAKIEQNNPDENDNAVVSSNSSDTIQDNNVINDSNIENRDDSQEGIDTTNTESSTNTETKSELFNLLSK